MGGIIEGAIAIAASVGASVGAGAAVGGAMIATGVGMTMSVVGAVTHDKLLSQIGMGFSAAGALTGLGAAAGLFDAGTAAATEGSLAGAEATSPGLTASGEEMAAFPEVGAGTTATDAPLGGGVGVTSPAASAAKAAPAASAPSADAMSGGIGANANLPTEAGTMPAQTSTITGQPGTIANESGASSLLNGPATTTPAAPAAPVAPGVSPGVSANPAASTFTGDVANPLGQANASDIANLSGAMQKAQPALTTFKNLQDSAVPGWWASLDPSAKAAIMMVGGQTVAGGVGGIFTGMQANKQMQLQQLINDQNRNQWNQMFARETSSPGLMQYGPTNGKATA